VLDEEQRRSPGSDPDVDDGDRGRRLICARCRHPITSAGQRIEVNGGHQHHFVNPHGYDFRVGCFAAAPGAVAGGPTTAEWTWFSGFTWQLAHCAACTTHLGWLFRSKSQVFHGLVLDRLVEEEPQGPSRPA